MTRVLVTLAALDLAVCGFLALAVCIVRARDNANVRATRRIRGLDQLIARETERVQLLDQLIEAADFDMWANELGFDLPVIDIEGDW